MNKGLKGKFQNKKGFTLVEMLIVVAIIAILIAVSIPLVTSSLEKAREAVDDANKRSAIALGNIYYLTGGDTGTETFDTAVTKYYSIDDNQEGKLVSEEKQPTTGYSKSKKTGVDKVLKVTIKDPADTGKSIVEVEWTDKKSS